MTALAMGRPLAPIIIQQRLTELGRIRIGEKGARGEPKQRSTFRLTSASERLLRSAQAVYGGAVQPWKDAPDEGYFELATTTAELDILIPPTVASYSQSLELWDRGGCIRRCDGITEQLSGKPCMCRPDARECQVTTRVSVMLPRLPGLGVWRLDTKGWNAGATLPTTLATLGALAPGQWIPAVLRIEKRSVKRKGADGRPQTRRFIVPVIDIIHGSIGQAIEEGLSVVPVVPLLNAGHSEREKVVRPALPPGPALPTRAEMPASEGPVARVVAPADEPPLPPEPNQSPAPSGDGGDSAPSPSPTPCEGFSATLGKCVRETHEGTNHRNKAGETWA